MQPSAKKSTDAVVDSGSPSTPPLVKGVYLLMVSYAISVTMVGPLMSRLIADYGLRLSQGGLIMTSQSIGGVLAILIGGPLADRLNKGIMTAGFFFIYVAALFAIATAPSYGVLLAMFFALGASTRLVDTVNNALVADLSPGRRSSALNLLHTIFGVGALFGPIFTRLLLENGVSWSAAYGFLGAFCALVAVAFVSMLRRHPLPVTVGQAQGVPSPKLLLGSKRMWLLCGVMVCYVGSQVGLMTWLPMYMETALESTPVVASVSLSLLWIGIIAGRFGASRLPNAADPLPIIGWGSLLSGLFLLVGYLSGSIPVVLTVVPLAGFAAAAVIPLLVNVACEWFPRNTGTASSMIFLSGSMASMTIPWLIGFIAEYAGFRGAILLTAFTPFGIFALVRVLQGLPVLDTTRSPLQK